ncbi:hypothetical protein CTAM01_04370 [Colletotrichum tamarilloi]|uniref:Uncharacterized protein n=1 Tax=Colletotrichum tamarilloi TaxID=1209934 RepID=A0ABQ9RI87_9PEZI|nr:uncharacterized protein CTAM01_04370 [Colletotrichum tamarilloi]KAK1504140.1 hypothetical protein CTAM01_04370 [Colletotrichum tamarilloi]
MEARRHVYPEPRRQDAPPRPHRFDFQVFRLVGSNFQLIDAIDHEESACIPWRTSSPASWLPPFITSPNTQHSQTSPPSFSLSLCNPWRGTMCEEHSRGESYRLNRLDRPHLPPVRRHLQCMHGYLNQSPSPGLHLFKLGSSTSRASEDI